MFFLFAFDLLFIQGKGVVVPLTFPYPQSGP